MFLCDFVLFCANKSIVSAPEGHGIQEVGGLVLRVSIRAFSLQKRYFLLFGVFGVAGNQRSRFGDVCIEGISPFYDSFFPEADRCRGGLRIGGNVL